MLVQLQRFPGINVVYKRGDSLHLADALSRAHLEEQLTNAEQLDINLVEDVLSDHQLARFAEATKEDAILSDLQQVILTGWPDSKGQVPPNAQDFRNYRHCLGLRLAQIFCTRMVGTTSLLSIITPSGQK